MWRAIGAGVAAQIGTVGAVLTYSDTTAIAGTLYTYSVKAVAAAGASAASASNTGYRNLTAPLSVAATDGTLTTGVTVTWAASTGATGYQVWRAIGAGVASQIATVAAVLSYSDTTAIAGTSYTYTVKSTGAVGVSAASLGNTGYRNLTAPLSVAATDGTSTANVAVTWAASTGATGYQVFRSGTTAAIGTVAAVLTYSDTTAVAGTSYTYTVKATGAVGVSAASLGNTGYRNRVGPATVTATDTDPTKVHVSWTAITGTPAATGYEVWRTIGDTAAVLLATTAPTTLFFDDTTITPGVTALYSVKAKYVLVGSSPATTVTTLPTSDTGIRPVGVTGGGDEGGIAGGPESSTGLPGGSGHGSSESGNFAAGSGDSQNESTDPAGEATKIPPQIGNIPDFCTVIATNLAGQIDTLAAALASHSQDANETAITQKLLERMRALIEPAIDNEPAVCVMSRGDVTLDGVIDNDDLAAFLAAWSANDLVGADLNRDGHITAEDMSIVLSAIDETNAATPPGDR